MNMKTLLVVLLLAGAPERPATAQTAIDGETIDGVFAEPERDGARQVLREGASSVFVRAGSGFLRIVVQSDPIGVASVCIGGADEVRVLHASAALGMVRYSRKGRPGETEFLVRRNLLPGGDVFVAVGIMPLERPDEIVGLPSAGAGDCALGTLVRGPAPTADVRFDPRRWAVVPGS
jgi:hypothetical protein